jgi:phytanoyl-CoA hydroxylase
MSIPTASPITARAEPPPLFLPEEVSRFHADGYLIVRGLIHDELREQMLAATLEGIERSIEPIEYEADLHYPGAPKSRQARGGRTARRLKQAHARHPVFTDWLTRPEILLRLQQLLGPGVVMPLAHHNCIMTKQPTFSSDTRWHQDIRYWSFSRPDLVSVWIALGQENPENGSLQLIPGSHAIDFEREQFDEELFFRREWPPNHELIASQVSTELEPGDALLFHCRLLHAANRNRTGEPKYSVVSTFRPGDNPPLPGTRSASLPELLIAGEAETK